MDVNPDRGVGGEVDRNVGTGGDVGREHVHLHGGGESRDPAGGARAPRTRSIQTCAGRLAVHDGGDARETVVLIHGWGVDSTVNWWQTYDVLVERHRVVLVDLPGHGASTSDGEFDLERCAQGVYEALDEIGVGVFTLCGYSLGGAVAQVMAAQHPRRVDGVVYIATAMRFDRAPRWMTKMMSATFRGFSQVPLPRARTTAAWGRPDLFATALRHDRKALAGSIEAACDYDGKSRIRRYDGPVVVIAAEHDHVVPLSRQLELAQAARAELIRTPHTHGVCFDPEFPSLVLRAMVSLTRAGARGGA